jgi:hypothetical protein
VMGPCWIQHNPTKRPLVRGRQQGSPAPAGGRPPAGQSGPRWWETASRAIGPPLVEDRQQGNDAPAGLGSIRQGSEPACSREPWPARSWPALGLRQ